MRFRNHREPASVAFQIAPLVDILLVLLCFFIITWSLARKENELDIRLPAANAATESNPVINQTVLNIKSDGTIIFNRNPIKIEDLRKKLKSLAELFPDYAIILRIDSKTEHEHTIRVLDTCREVGIWNVAFQTAKPQ